MRRAAATLRFTLIVAGLVAAAAWAAGQASPAAARQAPSEAAAPAASEAFSEVTEVELVEVDVRVADRRGRPATGLTAADFTLIVDGRPVEIAHFAELAAVAEDLAGSAPTVPRPLAGARLTAPGEGSAGTGRRIVLLLDDQHLEPGGRARVLTGMESFVADALAPGTEVMVARHQGGTLQIVEPFTADREALLAALAAVAEQAPAGVVRGAGYRDVFRQIRLALSEDRGDGGGRSCGEAEALQAQAMVQGYAAELGNDVQSTVGAVDSLVAALSAVPGEKVILYAGDGLELRPGLDLFHLLSELCSEHQRLLAGDLLSFDLTSSFTRLAAHANVNGVTFYTLQASGLEVDGEIDLADARFRPSTLTRRIRRSNLRHPLFLLAEETGGRAIFDANRFAAPLAEVADDLARHYTLAFVPDHPSEGRVHLLRVEVAGRGLAVRHRRSYQHRPLTERIWERMISTLVLGVEENQLGIAVSAGDAERGENGWRVPVRQKEVAVRVEGSTAVSAPGEERWLEIAVDLPPGKNVVAVGVRDELGGTASFVRRTVAIAHLGESPSAGEG